MTGNKFSYVIPIKPDPMYQKTTFTVRGTLLSDPKDCTHNITYHFNVKFENQGKQRLIENYKDDGNWSPKEKITQKNLFNESTFYLVFTLIYEESMIYVYKGWGHNNITEFETLHGLSEIESVRVWGDVQQIDAYSISYGEATESPCTRGFLTCACR